MLASSTGHPLVTLRADARSRAPTQLPPIREAHIALRLAEEAPDDEYSDLQQYLEWPTTSVGEELDRRTSLIKLVEGQEKKRFKAFVKQAKTCAADLESRRRLVEKEALKTSDIPPLRKNADFNLAELQRVEEEKGHASLDFLAALHDFHNQEILLYQACLRSEALYDYLEVLEDKRYEGGMGRGGKGRLPRPRFL